MTVHFSSEPGCWERHLQRKYGNPLFPEAARTVSQARIDEARRKDDEEVRAFQQDFQQALKEVSEFTGHVDTEIILGIKERLDRLYEQCAGFSGDYSAEKQALLRLSQVIMQAIGRAAAGDTLAEEELKKEQAAREIHQKLLDYLLVPHLLRADSPITREDLVPTLLSEDPETVRVVMSLFDPEQQAELRQEALDLVEALQRTGVLPPSAQASFQAMQAALQ
jgi:hypothetical protein